MRILTPGTGNQRNNKKKAIDYIIETNIVKVKEVDYSSGMIQSIDEEFFVVSAYAETPAALVATPNVDPSENSIYSTGLNALMYRQIKNDSRAFIYRVKPSSITLAYGSSTASWNEVKKASDKMWVCDGDIIKSFQ